MRKRRLLTFSYLLATSLVLWVNSVNAAAQEVNEVIREHIERHQMSGRLVLAGADIAGRDVYWRLYENNNYAPLWQEQERIDVLIPGAIEICGEKKIVILQFLFRLLLTEARPFSPVDRQPAGEMDKVELSQLG